MSRGAQTFLIMSEENEERKQDDISNWQVFFGVLVIVGIFWIIRPEMFTKDYWDDSKKKGKPKIESVQETPVKEEAVPQIRAYKDECTYCGGTGKCGMCHGTGSYPCDRHDTNQDGYCTTCNNRGTLTCYFHLSGARCDKCSGKGYITVYR